MPGPMRRLLAQPTVAWLLMFIAALALSWPFLDVVAVDCSIGPVSIEIVLQCQVQTVAYLFAVWGAMIFALLLIALTARERRRKSTEHA